MTRGRKPDALAIRRGGTTASIIPDNSSPQTLEKPPEVAMSPGMSELWDTFVGTGLTYQAQDGPALRNLVFTLELVRQLQSELIDENGNIRAMVGVGEPDPDTGEYLDMVENPRLKTMWAAQDRALKLADSLGIGPLARARLGLTQAAGAAATLSIAEQIDAAIARRPL